MVEIIYNAMVQDKFRYHRGYGLTLLARCSIEKKPVLALFIAFFLINEYMNHPSLAYRSRFLEWDRQSWVRNGKSDIEEFKPNLNFFSIDISLLFTHKSVLDAPPHVKKDLLVLQLYNYLEFTVWLELGPVNEVCDLLRRPSFLPWLPQELKEDVFKIYVDEGAHAQMSRSLMLAVESYTKIRPLKRTPSFIVLLDRLVAQERQEMAPLIKLFFTIISETLITGSLLRLPKDNEVQPSVRNLASAHASDEGRHHAYFKNLFELLWPRLPRVMRLKIGQILPEMILAFLRPDASDLSSLLEQFPEQFTLPGQIADEILASPSTRKNVSRSAMPTIQMLIDAGVFEEPLIRDAFQQSVWLDLPFLSTKF